MKNPVREFCKEREIPRNMGEAFIAYCKVSLEKKFNIKMTDTMSLIGDKIKPEEVESLWVSFVSDFKNELTKK